MMFRNFDRKIKYGLSLALIVALFFAIAMALADDISNNLDVSVDAVAEVMPLNVGGANGTTTLYLVERNGDGKNGCNLTGGTTLILSVSSSDTSIATVSPSSVTFTSCGFTQVLTVTPHKQGSATISLSQTSNSTNGTFDLAPATFIVTIAASAPANTAPSVEVKGVIIGTSYEIGSVPAATCQVTDAEDGNKTFEAILSAISGPHVAYGLGDQTASCSYTDAGGLTASASLTYSIVDTHAPVITVDSRMPEANDNSWNSDEVTVSWRCTDSGGSGVVADSVSQTVSTEGANQSVTGTCEDHAGNTASDTQSGINIDKTVPTISGTPDRAPNANHWYKADVTVVFNCADELSGVASCTSPITLGEGANQSETGIVTDKAGNSASTTVSEVNVDKTAPTITDLGTITGADGTNGWYKSTVLNKFKASDNLSGFGSSNSNPYEFTVSSGTAEGSAVTVSSDTVTDLAGNTAAAIDSAPFKIDLTDPTNIAFVGGPTDGGSYYFGSVPAAPTCTAEDGVSGLASCIVSGYSPAVGSHQLIATATDNAGRIATATRSYTVLAWTLNGFYQPVDMSTSTALVYNTVKNGSTVPLKFEIFAGSIELTDVAYVKSLTYAQTACDATATTDDIETTATGGTSLRFDTTAGQFVYNWKTPTTAGKCYRVTMTTQDSSSLVAYFKLK